MQLHQDHTPRDIGIDKLKSLVGSSRTCMVTELHPSGDLTSKPMTLLEMDAAGVMWFMTSVNALDQSDWKVNVSFSHEGNNTYVSVPGYAQAVQDRAKIHELWSPMCKPWFPEGPDSKDIALIKVTPDSAEFWDGPSNFISKGASLLASMVAGKPVGMGKHGVIRT
jgi:general stress protein 26